MVGIGTDPEGLTHFLNGAFIPKVGRFAEWRVP